ncbi:MAG: tetratricopeptide repeat protein [Planctomycetota bacterium]|nr:tetratricopeptide repeat protein [Planctomycetota bacterium]
MRTLRLRAEPLLRELAETSSAELDELAQDYISLLDVLVSSLGAPGPAGAPFAFEAEDLLAFITGRTYVVGPRERFGIWWRATRPILVRGGGALLVGMRLLQRESYAEAARLLSGLAEGGLLSAEADTLRRAASFLALFARPQWRMTSADIPRYFTEGHYFMALEMGVLRFPTAGLPEVTNACRTGKILRDSKRRLLEDALALWGVFDAELAPFLALLLKRLLEDKSRHCPTRASYWRRQWAERQASFEQPIALLMDGIVATAAGRLAQAAQLFEEAARREPHLSVPLINLVYVKLQAGKVDEARALARVIERRFPKDGYAFIALGRLFATQLEDTAEAERLFLKARDLTDPPTEALICLGEVKLMEGLYMEAQAYFEHARQADPALPDPRLGLARTYMETRNYKHAIEHLDAVVKSGPDEARDMACYLLYRTYREAGNDKRAFECLDKVPQRFFTEPDILDDIAGHLESDQQYAKAREFAVRAMILRASGQGRSNDADALNAM